MGKKHKTQYRSKQQKTINERELKEQQLQKKLKEKKKRKNSFAIVVEQLYTRTIEKKDLSNDWNFMVIYNCFATINVKRKRRLFRDILIHLHNQKCHKLLQNYMYIRAIERMVNFESWILNPIENWTRKSHNAQKQFADFIRYCFAKYEMPEFMDKVWFDNQLPQHRWYVGLGAGINIRKCSNLPIELSKKMAHIFMQAPAKLSVDEAFRYAQILGMGGDQQLFDKLISSRIGNNGFVGEKFWQKVILFFINTPMLATNKMHEIIDYLSHCRRESADYSIKGRTITSLLRDSDAWHIEISQEDMYGGYKEWSPSGIKPFELEQGKEEDIRTYTIVELLNSKLLVQEGRKMKHCVGTYAYDCVKKRCSIFSLRVTEPYGWETTLGTIEVRLNNRTIAQAKNKCNSKITPKARQVLEMWARDEDLKFGRYL